jgi:hypothetical protein
VAEETGNAESPGERSDVGVLFVHGIGSQARGLTLLAHAEPLAAWLDSRSKSLGRGPIALEESHLANEDEPPHASVLVPGPKARQTRWLLAESHWATSFPEPRPGDVLGWAPKFSIRAVRRLIEHLIRPADAAYMASLRSGGGAREASEETLDDASSPGEAIGAYQAAIYVVAIVAIVFLFLWVPIVVYVLLLVLLGALVVVGAFLFAGVLAAAAWIPGLRSRLAGITAALVSSVGDTYALLRQPIRASAMRTKIQEDLEWLASRCDHVVVVGHSQGAALSTAILTSRSNPEVDCLITVGGAVSLLKELQPQPVRAWRQLRPQMRWVNIWSTWDPVSAGPIADVGGKAGPRWRAMYAAPSVEELDESQIPWTLSPAPRTEEPERPIGLIGAALAGLTEAYRQQGKVVAGVIPRAPEVEESVDPGPEEVAVHNRASLTRDHNTYAENVEQVIRRLAVVAGGLVGLNDLDHADDQGEIAERRHVTAVRALGAARIVGVLAAFSIAGWAASTGLAAGAFIWAGEAANSINTDIGEWFSGIPGGGLGAAIRLLVITALLFGAWSGFQSWLFTRWCREVEDPEAWSEAKAGRSFALTFAGAQLLAVAISALAVDRILVASGDPEHLKATALVAGMELLILLWSFGGFRPEPLAAGPFDEPALESSSVESP